MKINSQAGLASIRLGAHTFTEKKPGELGSKSNPVVVPRDSDESAFNARMVEKVWKD